MSEILTREFLMEELPNLTPGAILAHDAALRAENERLSRIEAALANWHDEETRWIGSPEPYRDAGVREAISVIEDLAASASIARKRGRK